MQYFILVGHYGGLDIEVLAVYTDLKLATRIITRHYSIALRMNE